MEQLHMVTDTNLQSLFDYGTSDFPFKCYSDDLTQYDQQTIDWHWHRSFEITFVQSGSMTFSIMSEKYVLKQGDLLFLNSGVIHRFSAESCGSLRNLLFAPEFISSTENRVYRDCVAPVLQSGPMFLIIRAGEPNYEAIMEAFNDCFSAYHEADSVLYSLNLHAEVVHLWQRLVLSVQAGEQSLQHLNSVPQKRIQQMLIFIHENFGSKLSLNDIAATAGISTRECLRIFESCIQTSPVAYLNDYRIKIARQKLLDSSNSVTEIAEYCGFDNPGYFSKAFRKACGMSPREYRNSFKKNTRRI